MRVGLLTTSYPRHAGDIAGDFVRGFAGALASQGHEVEVLAPEPAERDGPEPAEMEGVRVVRVPYLRPRALQRTFYGGGVPDNLRTDARAWLGPVPFTLALARTALARRARWEAVVSHFAVPCGLVAAAVRGARRHVCVLHSADVHLLARMPHGAAVARALVQGSDTLWFVSEIGRRRVLDRLGSEAVEAAVAKSLVQPMGFDAPPEASAARRARARARLGLDRFTLLTVARLVPVKGLLPAIEGLGHRTDLEWLIAGDGPERAALSALAARLRLRVRVLGTITGPDKHALLHAADAFVLPSRVLPSGRTEGAPVALLEAMGCGVPVIASPVGGIADWLEHGMTGLAIDPREPSQLEQAIDLLRLEPARGRALADAARVRVGRFSWNAQAEGLARIVTGLSR